MDTKFSFKIHRKLARSAQRQLSVAFMVNFTSQLH